MVHDFFKAQPVEADIYFLRWIFHNWSDKYCIKILRALIPSLKPGAKVIVSEAVMPGPAAIPRGLETMIRGFGPSDDLYPERKGEGAWGLGGSFQEGG